jgi:hypothetical protein
MREYLDSNITLSPQDIERLLLRWITLGNKAYFREKYGQFHTVPALDQPRAELIRQVVNGTPAVGIDLYPAACTKMGFGTMSRLSTERYVENKLLPHYEDIKAGKHLPLYLVRRRDGKMVLQDGNHRACFAHAMGLEWEALVRDYRVMFHATWANPKKKLYQSLYVSRELVCNGQRQDALSRIDSVRQEDVEGRRVVVMGCNNGHDCFLSCERGASFAHGLDIDSGLIAYALMANTYMAYPCDFDAVDLSQPWDGGQFDTALVFSLYDSLPDQNVLIETLRRAGCQTVYFEGHCLTDLENDESGYRARYMSFLGRFGDVIPVWKDRFGTRWMYRCEKG